MRGVKRHVGRLGLGLCLAFLATSPAWAQQTASASAGADPPSIATSGEIVRFWLEIVVPDSALPVTITAVESDLHGDISDPVNPTILTTCALPADYSAPTPGWTGWVCEYEALVSAGPGTVTNTISATIRFSDSTEEIVSSAATVSVDDQLGTITGTLLDSDTGEPIPNMFVFGTCEGCGGFTDAAGRFTFVGVEPGTYRLRSGSAPAGGWDPAPPGDYTTAYAFEWYDEEPTGPAPIENATPVEVLPGGATDIVWELSIGGEITGTLTDFEGNPMTDALIAYWLTKPDGSYSPSEAGGYVEIGSDGAFRIFGLRSGAYLICFDTVWPLECWDDVPITDFPPDAGTPVVVGLGSTTPGIDAVLGIEGEPSGQPPILPFTGVDEVVGWLAGLSVLLGVSINRLARSRDS